MEGGALPILEGVGGQCQEIRTGGGGNLGGKELNVRISIVGETRSPGTYPGLPRYGGVAPPAIDNVKRLE